MPAELPPDVLQFARDLRDAFGPGTKLLAVQTVIDDRVNVNPHVWDAISCEKVVEHHWPRKQP
jgi:hypothetical protein